MTGPKKTDSCNGTDDTLQRSGEEKPTQIFLDWDDTLLCSSFLCNNGYGPTAEFSASSSSDRALLEELKTLEKTVYNLIRAAQVYGVVTIVTNAEAGWVELSAKKYVPDLLPLLADLTVISARSTFEPEFPDAPVQWKYNAFLEALKASEGVHNVMSFGDSHVEREAIKTVLKHFPGAHCKSVKFAEQPSPEQLCRQLEHIINCLPHIHQHQGDLDLCVTLEDPPAAPPPAPATGSPVNGAGPVAKRESEGARADKGARDSRKGKGGKKEGNNVYHSNQTRGENVNVKDGNDVDVDEDLEAASLLLEASLAGEMALDLIGSDCEDHDEAENREADNGVDKNEGVSNDEQEEAEDNHSSEEEACKSEEVCKTEDEEGESEQTDDDSSKKKGGEVPRESRHQPSGARYRRRQAIASAKAKASAKAESNSNNKPSKNNKRDRCKRPDRMEEGELFANGNSSNECSEAEGFSIPPVFNNAFNGGVSPSGFASPFRYPFPHPGSGSPWHSNGSSSGSPLHGGLGSSSPYRSGSPHGSGWSSYGSTSPSGSLSNGNNTTSALSIPDFAPPLDFLADRDDEESFFFPNLHNSNNLCF